jgi:hypothetical protein
MDKLLLLKSTDAFCREKGVKDGVSHMCHFYHFGSALLERSALTPNLGGIYEKEFPEEGQMKPPKREINFFGGLFDICAA